MKVPEEDLSVNDWQIAEIEKALLEADRGEFATDEEVAVVFSKWSRVAKGEPTS
jgi:RHH-type rel operon transcriptional repressor/antitoxin RelB